MPKATRIMFLIVCLIGFDSDPGAAQDKIWSKKFLSVTSIISSPGNERANLSVLLKNTYGDSLIIEIRPHRAGVSGSYGLWPDDYYEYDHSALRGVFIMKKSGVSCRLKTGDVTLGLIGKGDYRLRYNVACSDKKFMSGSVILHVDFFECVKAIETEVRFDNDKLKGGFKEVRFVDVDSDLSEYRKLCFWFNR